MLKSTSRALPVFAEQQWKSTNAAPDMAQSGSSLDIMRWHIMQQVASNGRLSQEYWPGDEAGIEVEGEYSTMRYQ